MSGAHLHLIVNHIPVLGAVFGLLLLSYGVVKRNDGIVRSGLWTLAIVGLAGLAAYLTGEPAEEVVERLPGISESVIERHEEAAYLATIGGGVVGLVAMAGLLLHRAGRPVGGGFSALMLLLTLGLFGGMAWTANLGGQIRHAEIRSGRTADAGPAQERAEDGEDDEDEDDDEDDA
jgi:uncharacterized membrane protein